MIGKIILNLIKTSFLSLFATSIKILSALFINKALSLFIGPSGIATIGQFQNVIQIAATISQGGILPGITKYTAEYNSISNHKSLNLLWSSAFRIILLLSIIVSVVLITFSAKLSIYILNDKTYTIYIALLGISIFFITLNSFFLSIINGLKQIRFYIFINITQSLFMLIYSIILIYLFGLKGALFSLVTNQAVIFMILIIKIRNKFNINLKYSHIEGKKLLLFSTMALTSAIVGPASLIAIRTYLTHKISLDASGYWQSMWYISSMYLMVITTTLSIYYMPRLSEITKQKELIKELYTGLIFITPLLIIMSSTIYILREFIIELLFSKEFIQMEILFKWQLSGDILKIISWLFSYILIAKAKAKLFIVTEILNFTFFSIASFTLINYFGLIGVSYSYFISNLVYLIIVSTIVYKVFLTKNSTNQYTI